MKLLGKLLCKFLTYWFTSKEEREREMLKCLACLEPRNVEKTRQNFQRKKPRRKPKKKKNFGSFKD